EWESCGDVGRALSHVRSLARITRGSLREISRRSDTPIEPPAQTELLDATEAQLGVLLALVPGAGGGDAVVALVLPSAKEEQPTAAARERLERLWRAWPLSPPFQMMHSSPCPSTKPLHCYLT
ncbi:MAG: hypothetical protein SGPRY_008595, partial [Prymnesium sp.]